MTLLKILGASLIIGGSYLIGRIIGRNEKKRYAALCDIEAVFNRFVSQLREERIALQDVLEESGDVGAILLEGKCPEGLSSEEKEKLAETVTALRTLPYRECLSVGEHFLEELREKKELTKKKNDTAGKALPLVTGTIGFMVALLLY